MSCKYPRCVHTGKDSYLGCDCHNYEKLTGAEDYIADLETLIKNCQSDLTKYLTPDGTSAEECVSALLGRLDGPEWHDIADKPHTPA